MNDSAINVLDAVFEGGIIEQLDEIAKKMEGSQHPIVRNDGGRLSITLTELVGDLMRARVDLMSGIAVVNLC